MRQASPAKFRDPLPLWDGQKLRDWRESRNLSLIDACEYFEISLTTLSRYERGHPPPLDIANKIVAVTRGHVRYRDFYWNFHPEYA